MKEIGGYFELELKKHDQQFQHSKYSFKSGRSSFSFIISIIKPSKIYIPYYTCNALIEPLEMAKIDYEFYSINDSLEPLYVPELRRSEYFLVINYFDLKREYVERLSTVLNDQLIIDNSQAFFYQIQPISWAFNSARKFFGVPDGSYLTVPKSVSIDAGCLPLRNKNYKTEHLILRLHGHTTEGYPYFKENEQLCNSMISGMSLLSEKILSGVSFRDAIDKRMEHFALFHNHLANYNLLNYDSNNVGCPNYYPLLPKISIDHSHFWKENIFVPIFWEECRSRGNCQSFLFESEVLSRMLPIPIDHRYNQGDMERVLIKLKTLLK